MLHDTHTRRYIFRMEISQFIKRHTSRIKARKSPHRRYWYRNFIRVARRIARALHMQMPCTPRWERETIFEIRAFLRIHFLSARDWISRIQRSFPDCKMLRTLCATFYWMSCVLWIWYICKMSYSESFNGFRVLSMGFPVHSGSLPVRWTRLIQWGFFLSVCGVVHSPLESEMVNIRIWFILL